MPEKTICNLTFAEIKELAELVSDRKLGKIEVKMETTGGYNLTSELPIKFSNKYLII